MQQHVEQNLKKDTDLTEEVKQLQKSMNKMKIIEVTEKDDWLLLQEIGKDKTSFYVQSLSICTRAALAINQYSLKNFSILDSDTTIHIFNKITWFLNFWSASYENFVWAEKSKIIIQEYRNVDIQVFRSKSKLQILHLYDIAYCEEFTANLVFFWQLQKLDYWWDTQL